MTHPKFKTRKTWKNHVGNQETQPLRTYRPADAAEIQAIVNTARPLGARVRCVGSGHSWSDAAITSGFLIDPGHLNYVDFADPSRLDPGIPPEKLVEVECGVTAKRLNKWLDKKGLALPNMGGFDGQTLVGAISTSTHGTGLTHGPLAEMVKSIDLVVASGEIVRVEHDAGITDAAKSPHRLIQNDQIFYAAVIGLGSVGIIVSMTIEVRDAFWLEETRTLTDWATLKPLLLNGAFPSGEHDEFLINLNTHEGANACLITRRDELPEAEAQKKRKLLPAARRSFVAELPRFLQTLFGKVVKNFFKISPRSTPGSVARAMEAIQDESYTNKSFKVFNIGNANFVHTISAEYGLPLADWTDQDENTVSLADAVDRLIEITTETAQLGQMYLAAPVSLRFVKASLSQMSMMHGRDTCMIEIFMMAGTHGLDEILDRYERALYAFRGRPHWGQHNSMTAGLLDRLYDQQAVADWRSARATLNKVTDGTGKTVDGYGLFDSPLTNRLGLSDLSFHGIQ